MDLLPAYKHKQAGASEVPIHVYTKGQNKAYYSTKSEFLKQLIITYPVVQYNKQEYRSKTIQGRGLW